MITPDGAHRFDGEERTPAERELLSAAIVGAPADFRVGHRELDDPAKGASWGTDRTLQAELLARLLVGDLTPKQDRVRTVQVRGASHYRTPLVAIRHAGHAAGAVPLLYRGDN
jgi:hypothetical protein